MASIRCNHGGAVHTHHSVLEVKQCAGYSTRVEQLNETMAWAKIQAEADKLAPEAAALSPVNWGRDAPQGTGVFLTDGDYYKVQISRGSGHMYAKKAYKDYVDESTLTNPKYQWSWEYARGAIDKIRESHRVRADQASEFGKLYSVCINCFNDLTREESMDRGYGPTCARNFGWPYDYSRRG